MAVHVRYNSWYISLPSSTKQKSEMTEFCAFRRTWTMTAKVFIFIWNVSPCPRFNLAEPDEGCQRPKSTVATIMLLKAYQKWFLCYHLRCSLKIFINVFASCLQRRILGKSVKKNSFHFFRKMLMSALLLRFKANYLEKMYGYSNFSSGMPIALAKIYFFRVVLTWRKNLCIY